MEGANLSGDLASPARSIGRGTLMAIGLAFATYVTLIFIFAASFDR
jgi:amino acid transporter